MVAVNSNPESIAQWWEEYKSNPSDQDLRNRLVEHYLPLVRYHAQRVWQRLPDGVELDDLISAGVFGLMDAIDAFDLTRDVKFETYCAPRIRGAMLDELRKQYVTVARAKGLSEFQVIVRYPTRLAINPILSGVMWLLPWLFSGGIILEIVLNLQTAGPALYASLRNQDMYMAGAYILITGVLTAISAILSDVLLAVSDPRIRFGGVEGA